MGNSFKKKKADNILCSCQHSHFEHNFSEHKCEYKRKITIHNPDYDSFCVICIQTVDSYINLYYNCSCSKCDCYRCN